MSRAWGIYDHRLVQDDHSDDPFVLHLQNHVWEDVTLHNSSLPPLAIKSPECLGLLHQLDRSTDTWVQHYCILKDGCLYFYASIRSTQASGMVSTLTWNNSNYNNNSNDLLALWRRYQVLCYVIPLNLLIYPPKKRYYYSFHFRDKKTSWKAYIA